MTRPNFNMERILTQMHVLETLRYRSVIPVTTFQSAYDDGAVVNPGLPADTSFTGEMHIQDTWRGRDTYMWLRFTQTFPKSWKGKDVVGVFDFGRTGMGGNDGFESLLYINGVPVQGVDSNHKEVFFNLEETGYSPVFTFRLWSGLEGGGEPQVQFHRLKTAFFGWLDANVDRYRYLVNNCIATIGLLDDNASTKYHLEDAVVQSYGFLDWSEPRSNEFYESAGRSLEYLEESLRSIATEKDVLVACVGHTHIDLAWLWRYRHTREKAVRSFLTVNRLMDRYPEYVFMHTSPQLYEAVKQDMPPLYEQIKKRIQQGRWEPSGAMWVESDCNVTSGESLVRQLVYGKRFFRKEFGKESSFLWLPDVFGYSWALPQLLKLAKVDTFVTTKISWNDTNHMPHDTFWWRGIDGTEIMTHFITTPDTQPTTPFYTYNGYIQPQSIQGVWQAYQDKDINNELLVCYGYGDGGGGPNRDMLENLKALKQIPGIPQVRTCMVDEYLENLHKNICDKGDKVAVWDGELYLEFHRGTYTSQARIKRMNRKLELVYRNAECLQTIACLARGGFSSYPNDLIEDGWKLILKNQFHDILPGSSIHEVYEDTENEYEKAMSWGLEIQHKAQVNLGLTNTDTYTVFNTASFERTSLVRLPKGGCELVTVSPLSYAQIRPVKQKVESPFILGENSIDAPHAVLQWNEKGQIISLFDKAADREVLCGAGNLLEVSEDRPRAFDAWELESTINLKTEYVEDIESIEVIENGPLSVCIRFVWRYRNSKIVEDLIVYAHTSRLDFHVMMDWQEKSKILRVAFPVNVRSTVARYDIQFGSLERPTHMNTSWDAAKFEVVGHQWADLAETGFGVALLNDSKYGYDIHNNVMRLSLLKSAEYPDHTAEQGKHEFTYALFVHTEPWYESRLIEEAWDLNDPILVFSGSVKSTLPHFDFSQCNAFLDALKKSEDGQDIIVRLHENRGGTRNIRIGLPSICTSWMLVDLLEEPMEDTWHGDSVIEYNLHPYEVATFRIRL
jgi:alpha-mannosidase